MAGMALGNLMGDDLAITRTIYQVGGIGLVVAALGAHPQHAGVQERGACSARRAAPRRAAPRRPAPTR
jgi:hypothetical protein